MVVADMEVAKEVDMEEVKVVGLVVVKEVDLEEAKVVKEVAKEGALTVDLTAAAKEDMEVAKDKVADLVVVTKEDKVGIKEVDSEEVKEVDLAAVKEVDRVDLEAVKEDIKVTSMLFPS